MSDFQQGGKARRRQPGLFTFLPDRPLLTLRPNRRSSPQTTIAAILVGRPCNHARSAAAAETRMHITVILLDDTSSPS